MSRNQNHHYNNLRRIFGKYMRTIGKESHDVWLVSGVDKKKIAGHQFVLGACSSYFDSIFHELNESFECEETGEIKMVVIIPRYNSKTLEKLIDFMYKGPDALRDDSDDKDWNELYAFGKEFEVHGLLESILEKRKTKKDENENVKLDGPDNNFEILNLRTSPNLMDLEELLSQDTDNPENTQVLIPIKAKIYENPKEKWIERSDKIMEQIRNGTKDKPTTARKFLNDIFSDSVKFKPAEKGILGGKTFCEIEIDGQVFSGYGDNVDEAREKAALQVLQSYLKIEFPIECQ